jgi:hypothetical protein
LPELITVVTMSTAFCATSEAGYDIGSCQSESHLRLSVLSAVRADGQQGPLTVLRDDTRGLNLWTWESNRYVFYEVIEGGYEQGDHGQIIFQPVSHPLTWRVLVDCETGKVYRMFGFRSNDEFSVITEALGLELDESGARVLTERYVTLSYASTAEIVASHDEFKRFFESEVSVFCDDNNIPGEWARLKKSWGRAFRNEIKPIHAIAAPGGFTVRAYAARTAGAMGRPPRIELHALEVQVMASGGVKLSTDRLVVQHTLSSSCGD